MTIRNKLTLNVVIVLLIVGAVAATSIIGMGFIKSKLSYLTERSTPYQMKTMELQRAIQSSAVDLIRVSTSGNNDEYRAHRTEAEKSLSDVMTSQQALDKISGGGTSGVYDELSKIASELFETTAERLSAEDSASSANKTITQKLKDTANKLRDLNSKIKAMQNNRSATFTTSFEGTKLISTELRDIESLKVVVKDVQVAFLELQKAKDRKAVIIARGKANSTISQALLNEHLRKDKTLNNDIKLIEGKLEEAAKHHLSLLSQPDDVTKNRSEDLNKEINETLTNSLLHIEQETLTHREKYGLETRKQGNAFE
ncbi:MAG: hypothetical protein HZC49_00875, partial [Nitrospirae bacterium]|nr:hypothetical protein [Nitrospirota bacterium]